MSGIDKSIQFFYYGIIFCAFLLTACKVETPIGKWKDGEVPYYLSGDFTYDEVATIRRAMDDWEAVADVHFVEVTPRAGAYHINKVSENSWSSSIGENNSECEMVFGSGGNTYSHVLHELGHALGLLHEHQRPDRDKFVNIFWVNIIAQYLGNFEKRDNPLYVEEDYNYDYNSIMHYPETSFSIDGISTTIESKDSNHQINRLDSITNTDAQKIVEIYGPPEGN